jgi:DNA-binding Lrp family transcriptional regulator
MIDTLDRRILRELQQDARITHQKLAELVHLSPSA